MSEIDNEWHSATCQCDTCMESYNKSREENLKEANKFHEKSQDQNKKLVRIEMEWDNGDIQALTDEQAEEWLEKVNGFITFCWAHGMKFPEFKWDNK
jgi:hypothetical protein